MSKEKDEVTIIAHRGASKIAPENTIKAFRKAIELGADYVEFDVHLSKDEEIIIIHDDNTLRTTGHEGLIKNVTLQELMQLDAGEGEKIPTLNELIQVTKGKINLQLEIKAPNMTDKIVETFKNAKLIDSTLISAFDHSELIKIQELEPNLKVALLVFQIIKNKTVKEAIKNKFHAIHPYYKMINPEFIKKAHDNGIRINAWTVDSKNAMRKLIEMGIDGFITNNIEGTKRVLNRI